MCGRYFIELDESDIANENEYPAFEAPWAKGRCVKAPLHSLLPDRLTTDFIEGMEKFGKKIEGFSGPEAVVAGIESRTSSPVLAASRAMRVASPGASVCRIS